MEKQRLLRELADLLNIPQIERLIAHKIEELKDIYRDEIDLYFGLLENYRKNAYGKMYICGEEGDEAPKTLQSYSFVLDKDINNEWVVTGIEPTPPPGKNINDIIPPLIIKYMISFKTSSTHIETATHFFHPKLKGKTYNLRFTRYSDYHLLGSITEVEVVLNDVPSFQNENKFNNLVNIDDYYKNKEDELNYKEIIYYLEQYPAFREHTFSEFFMKWKPLIDGKLLLNV